MSTQRAQSASEKPRVIGKRRECEAKMDGALDVVKNSLDSQKMIIRRIMEELVDVVNSIR